MIARSHTRASAAPPGSPRRLRAQRHARAGLAWGLFCFVALQLGLTALLWSRRLELPDPEYARKLAALRARLAARPPRGPLVVLLGSSRTGVGFRPALLPRYRLADGTEPVVFNFALCGTGPAGELLCLRRLLADGVHPDWLLVEAWPALIGTQGGPDELRLDPKRLLWRDRAFLGRAAFSERARRWTWAQLLPWFEHRTLLLTEYAPAFLPPARRLSVETNWSGLDGWGWLSVPGFKAAAENPYWRLAVEQTRAAYASCFGHFQPDPDNAVYLRQLLGLCHDHGIRVALVLMPDGFHRSYSPKAVADIDRFLEGLGRQAGVPVIAARDWIPETGFVEGVHPSHPSAAAFTQRFWRDVLLPLLEGRPVPSPPPEKCCPG